MYRSTYHHNPARPKHEVLETIESTITKHLDPPEPDFTTLLVPYEVRNRHIYIVGKTQHGKSTLFHSMISQDIENGAGVCVIDAKPSGEKPNLVDSVLNHIPPHRKDDVIYFDAANPIPIDVMSWKTEEERQTLSADLMLTFMQFMTQKEGERWPGNFGMSFIRFSKQEVARFLKFMISWPMRVFVKPFSRGSPLPIS
jgi:hypothetical protein